MHRDNINVAVGGTYAYVYQDVPSSTVTLASNAANAVVIDTTYALDDHSLSVFIANLLYTSAALNTGDITQITKSDIELIVQSSGLIIDTAAASGAFGRRHMLQTALPPFAVSTPSAAFAQGFAEDIADKLSISEDDVTVAFVLEAQDSTQQFEVILSVHVDRCSLCDLPSSSSSTGGDSSGSGSLSNSALSAAATGRKMLASPSVDSSSASSSSSGCVIEGYYKFDGFRFNWILRDSDLSHPPNSPCFGGSSASSADSGSSASSADSGSSASSTGSSSDK